jgi:hypothetical protein
MADEERKPSHLTSICLRHLMPIADAQVTDANADVNKDVKAEEMGEPVRFGLSLNFDFFFVANSVLQSAAEKASSGLQEKLDQNALPIRAYLEQVFMNILVIVLMMRATCLRFLRP